jgi:hypothetical protein
LAIARFANGYRRLRALAQLDLQRLIARHMFERTSRFSGGVRVWIEFSVSEDSALILIDDRDASVVVLVATIADLRGIYLPSVLVDWVFSGLRFYH